MLGTLDIALGYKHSYDSMICKCECFIFGTESCVPVMSVGECGRQLFEDTNGFNSMGAMKSWLNAYNTPESSWERGNCFLSIDTTIIPKEAIWKSLPGWIMLSRRHAEEIVALVSKFGDWKEIDTSTTQTSTPISHPIIRAFGTGGTFDRAERGVFAPEEMFFATMLSILGYLRQNVSFKLHLVELVSISFLQLSLLLGRNG